MEKNRRCLLIDEKVWKWLLRHRDDYLCDSVSEMIRNICRCESQEGKYRENIRETAATIKSKFNTLTYTPKR